MKRFLMIICALVCTFAISLSAFAATPPTSAKIFTYDDWRNKGISQYAVDISADCKFVKIPYTASDGSTKYTPFCYIPAYVRVNGDLPLFPQSLGWRSDWLGSVDVMGSSLWWRIDPSTSRAYINNYLDGTSSESFSAEYGTIDYNSFYFWFLPFVYYDSSSSVWRYQFHLIDKVHFSEWADASNNYYRCDIFSTGTEFDIDTALDCTFEEYFDYYFYQGEFYDKEADITIPSGTAEAPIVTPEAPIGSTEAPSGTVEAPSGSTNPPSGSTDKPPYDNWEDDKNTVTGAFDFLKNAGNGLSSFFSTVFSFLPPAVLGLIAAAVVLIVLIGVVKAFL